MRFSKPALKQRLLSIRGLVTVPGSIVLVLWAFSFGFVVLDGWLKPGTINFLAIEYDTALSILGTIATGSITTLSLVYSLMLVVFTLAAGNIAPRLLQRFTRDSVSQVTAGLLGGTFLFSLTILHQTRPDFVPGFSIAASVALSVISVLQLIYFVHEVSRSVTIDEEIAEISMGLKNRLDQLIAIEEEQNASPQSGRPPSLNFDINVRESGYLTSADEAGLLELADNNDLVIMVLEKPGSFLLEGQKIACCNLGNGKSDVSDDELRAAVLDRLTITQSRGSDDDDVEYAINMLVEIALRALSPGVNDTFTAIACVDRMSAAFANLVKSKLRTYERYDDQGNFRVVIKGYNAEDIFNTAFSPLRRASRNNLLMAKNLGDAMVRLHSAATEEHKPALRKQLKLLKSEWNSASWLPEDHDFMEKRFNIVENTEK